MIYFDNSATHPILPCVQRKITDVLPYIYNPSSTYSVGRETRKLIDESRKIVADFINCDVDEVVFTSGASESSAIAVNTICGDDDCTVGISPFEHDSLFNNPLSAPFGSFSIHMLVNNEIGEDYTDLITNNPIVYSDTTAAMGNIHVDVKQLGVSMAGFSAEKLGGLSGCGVLYVKNGMKVKPIVYGHQEKTRRGGTENTLGIISLGEAIKYSQRHLDEKYERCVVLKQTLLDELSKRHLDFIVNGTNTIPQICSLSFNGVEGESIGLWLDKYGICVSTGSACNSGSLEPSHVLKAIGVPEKYINGTIRISLSLENTVDEVKYTVDKIEEIIKMIK